MKLDSFRTHWPLETVFICLRRFTLRRHAITFGNRFTNFWISAESSHSEKSWRDFLFSNCCHLILTPSAIFHFIYLQKHSFRFRRIVHHWMNAANAVVELHSLIRNYRNEIKRRITFISCFYLCRPSQVRFHIRILVIHVKCSWSWLIWIVCILPGRRQQPFKSGSGTGSQIKLKNVLLKRKNVDLANALLHSTVISRHLFASHQRDCHSPHSAATDKIKLFSVKRRISTVWHLVTHVQ